MRFAEPLETCRGFFLFQGFMIFFPDIQQGDEVRSRIRKDRVSLIGFIRIVNRPFPGGPERLRQRQ